MFKLCVTGCVVTVLLGFSRWRLEENNLWLVKLLLVYVALPPLPFGIAGYPGCMIEVVETGLLFKVLCLITVLLGNVGL